MLILQYKMFCIYRMWEWWEPITVEVKRPGVEEGNETMETAGKTKGIENEDWRLISEKIKY